MVGDPKPRDKIEVKYEGKTYVGILMPRPELSDPDYITLKLDSGYDVGLLESKIESMKVSGHVPSVEQPEPGEHHPDTSRPSVSILATGGTIASRVDYLTGGVHSAFNADELISAVPELGKIANVKGRQVFNKFSENMTPGDWVKLASEVYSELKSGVDGVVITHGTDTMGYSSAALSFMLETPVPVVLTGAQRSSDRGSSDAALNLIHAAVFASKADYGGVCVLMHGEPADSYSLVHSGVKVRKMHSSRRDAFQSINTRALAKVFFDRVEIEGSFASRGGEIGIDTKIEENVVLIKYYPGMSPTVFESLVGNGVKGVIIEGTGLGHVSESLFKPIKSAISAGVSIGMTTQTIFGRVNMDVYSTGRMLLKLGVIPCGDMLPETAYVKLMWVLGHADSSEEVRRLMLSNLRGEIGDKTPIL